MAHHFDTSLRIAAFSVRVSSRPTASPPVARWFELLPVAEHAANPAPVRAAVTTGALRRQAGRHTLKVAFFFHKSLIGVVGKSHSLSSTLDGGRIGIAAQALGIAEGALERTIEYTKERKQFGRSIAQQQNTQFKLADMATRIDAAKYLVYAAAMKKAEFAKNPKVSYSVDAAKAKLFAAETAMAVTTECVQLFGGYGYIREYDVERMMRDAKITEIYEGTSEVQRMVISGSLLR